jgi:glycosyltransferase involved in cell wall biosynthesis
VQEDYRIYKIMSRPHFFSIIIPTFKRAHSLSQLLASIVRQKYQSSMLEIIVIDSFSDDGSAEVIAKFSSENPNYHLIYINTEINTPSHKRNIGINTASLDWLIFLDDDCVLTDNYLEYWIQSILKIGDKNAVFFGEVRYPPQLIRKSNYYRYRDSRHFVASKNPQPIDFIKITTMNMLCNQNMLRRSGVLFDPDYKFSCEDTDFSYRLKRANFNFFSSKATVYHYESCQDLINFLNKCKRVYPEGYKIIQMKNPSLAKKMIWKYFTPTGKGLLRNIHSIIMKTIFYKRISSMLAKFLFNADSNSLLYSEKLFMYVIISAYFEGTQKK